MFWFKMIRLKLSSSLTHFNTLYVLVQAKLECSTKSDTISFQYIICFGSRSELDWNGEATELFQYIICFGSRRGQEKAG